MGLKKGDDNDDDGADAGRSKGLGAINEREIKRLNKIDMYFDNESVIRLLMEISKKKKRRREKVANRKKRRKQINTFFLTNYIGFFYGGKIGYLAKND